MMVRYHRSELKVKAKALELRLRQHGTRDGIKRKPITVWQLNDVSMRVGRFLFGYRKWRPAKPAVPYWRDIEMIVFSNV